MENQVTDGALSNESRSNYAAQDATERPQVRLPQTLRIPVGTNLADVERWMIFATLQKCGGNKTRAAALLGVSLKTLYNRLNAYRTQGLAMDYDLTNSESLDDEGEEDAGRHAPRRDAASRDGHDDELGREELSSAAGSGDLPDQYT